MQTVLFRKSLLDLVKGLRSAKGDESAFINKCLAEIKAEVKATDHTSKANALQKLCFLYMLGYDVSFCHFHVVECMSQPSFMHRRTAYLLASLAFTPTTDVIMLTPHLFKKAFSPTAVGARDLRLMEGLKYETGAAINCLANICNDQLAETLLEDVHAMMNSSKPYLRKKAVLALYPIFKVYPRALILTFDRLKSKLKDDDAGVQNAAVNVICELARKNPKNYLPLLPQLFELLNNSSNNWMLIKLVKLLGSLMPSEPRLARKLQEPLTHIISNTPAKSLLYECINTASACEVMPKSLVRLCLDKLRTFVEDLDQNLKYLGLLGLNQIMKQNVKAVAAHRELIIACLEDPDVTIRMRAMDLIISMVNERNLESIIRRLTEHMEGTDGSYRDHVLEKVILVCAKNDYEYVSDFGWYVQLLTNMTKLSSMSHRNAELIANQLIDVTVRVPEVREFSVQMMEELVVNNGLIGDSVNMTSNAICRVLRAAAYIVGEFAQFVENHLTLARAMLQSRISSLPGDIQCFFVHNALKVVCFGLAEVFSEDSDDDDSESDEEEEEEDADSGETKKKLSRKMQECLDLVKGSIQLLEPLGGSPHIEVQERATAYLYFLKWLQPEMEQIDDSQRKDTVTAFTTMFATELMPVLPKHQKLAAKKIPDGLDLEAWIGDPWPEKDSDDESEDDDGFAENVEDDIDKWYSDSSLATDDEGAESDDSWGLGGASGSRKKKGKMKKKGGGSGGKKEEARLQRDRRRQAKKEFEAKERARKQGPYYLFGDGGSGSSLQMEGGMTEEEIKKIPSETRTDDLGVKVMPKRKKRRSKKVYTVRGRTKMKGEAKLKKQIGEEEVAALDVDDPLALDLDYLKKSSNLEMPTVGVYTRTDAYSAAATQRPATADAPDEKRKKKKDKGKGKKGAKKGKKKGSRKSAAVDDDSDTETVSSKRKRKGAKGKGKKKGSKKKASKKGSKKEAVAESEVASDQKDAEETVTQMDDSSLFGFLGIEEKGSDKKTAKKPKSSSKKKTEESKSAANSSDAFDVFGFFEDTSGGGTAAAELEEAKDDTGAVAVASSKASKKRSCKKSKSKRPKASALSKSSSSEKSASEHEFTLFEDENIRIKYTVNALTKRKGGLQIDVTVDNLSRTLLKSAKAQLTATDNLKHKSKSEKESFVLGKGLGSNKSATTKVLMRATALLGAQQLAGRLMYTLEGGVTVKQKVTLKVPSFALAMRNADDWSISDSDALNDFVEGSDECSDVSVSKMKLPSSVSLSDAVDDFVQVFGLKQVSRDSKKASFYGEFILGHSAAVLLKISSAKHALHVTVRSFSTEFAEALTNDFREHLTSDTAS